MKRSLGPILPVAFLILSLCSGIGCYFDGGSATASETVEKALPLTSTGSFRLDNVNGPITLTSWDKAEVHVKAVKKARSFSEEKAKEALGKTQVVVRAEGAEVIVETVHPKKTGLQFGGAAVAVEYEVTIPRGARASVTTVNGRVTAEVPDSDLTCESTNGALEIRASGKLKAQSVNGRVDFRAKTVDLVETTNGSVKGILLGVQAGSGRVETTNGAVSVRFEAGAAAAVTAENVNGSVDCALQGFSVEKHRVSGSLGSGGGTLAVETVNGSITIGDAATQ